jgi:UDP-N-acetylmuramoyl-tripeptide--D-alanyl-D-alanine ligase
LRRHALKLDTTIVSFGGSADAKSRLIAYETVGEGCRVAADILGHRLSFEWSFPGRHLALNAVAALTAVALMGADLKKARDALETYEVPEGRGRRQYFDLQGGPVLLIDESYNANPASMRAAIEALGAVDRKRFSRRVVILGDMLELGHGGPEFHSELAPIVDKNGIDLVFCAGPLMRRLFDALPESKRGGYAEKAEQLEDLAIKSLRPGDAVMVKGSLGSRMGPLAERLRQHFSTLASGPEGQSEA